MRKFLVASAFVALLASVMPSFAAGYVVYGEASPEHAMGGLHPQPVTPSDFGSYFDIVQAHGRTYVLDRSTEQIVYSPDFAPYMHREYGYVFLHGQPILVDFTNQVIHWQ